MAERNDLRNDLSSLEERSAEQIRHDIAAKRESISETVDRLGDRIQEKLDWREWVAEYPYLALGAAAGLGLVLSGIFKPRPSPADRIREALAETIEDFSANIRDSVGSLAFKVAGPGVLKASVGAMVTKAVIDLIKNKINQRPPTGEMPAGTQATGRETPPNREEYFRPQSTF